MINLVLNGLDVHKYLKAGGYKTGFETVYDSSNAYESTAGQVNNKVKGYKDVIPVSLEFVSDADRATLKALSKNSTGFSCTVEGSTANYRITGYKDDCAIEKTSSNLWNIDFTLESVLLSTDGL